MLAAGTRAHQVHTLKLGERGGRQVSHIALAGDVALHCQAGTLPACCLGAVLGHVLQLLHVPSGHHNVEALLGK